MKSVPIQESPSDYESVNNHVRKSNSAANIPAFDQPLMREQLVNKMIVGGDFAGALNEVCPVCIYVIVLFPR